MVKHNYLVSLFVSNKHVNSYFSVNLDDLVTIKAMHRNCEIDICDLQDFTIMPKEQVEYEIRKSGVRWKRSMERRKHDVSVVKPQKQSQPKEKRKKYWERPVLCVETGQIFPSVRDCSDKTGIPYMTIINCIRNGNATRGVHFVNATL